MPALLKKPCADTPYVGVPMELPKHEVRGRKRDGAERAAMVGIAFFGCLLIAALTHGASHAGYDTRAFTDAKPGIAINGTR